MIAHARVLHRGWTVIQVSPQNTQAPLGMTVANSPKQTHFSEAFLLSRQVRHNRDCSRRSLTSKSGPIGVKVEGTQADYGTDLSEEASKRKHGDIIDQVHIYRCSYLNYLTILPGAVPGCPWFHSHKT